MWAADLDGTWIRYSNGLTFTAHNKHYEWRIPTRCRESGELSGALEFSPASGLAAPCFSPVFYSASVHWTDNGLEFEIDNQSNLVDLEYQP